MLTMRYFNTFQTITIAILALIVLSCNVINPPEKIPSYLYINDINVNANVATQGTTNDNIVDAWVYVNGSLIGTYELPAKIPVIADGNYDLEVFAGIKRSGFVAQREIYPFFESYKETKTSIPNQTDTLTPIVTYKSNATIWLEDFEDPGVKFSRTTSSDTTLYITTNSNEIREGNGSGKVSMSATDSYFEARTNEPTFNSFPKFGARVYMEIEYKVDVPFSIDVLHADNTLANLVDDAGDVLILNSTFDNWKKTYIDLTEAISSKTAATKYQINIKAFNPNNGTPTLLFDNIKVVYLR